MDTKVAEKGYLYFRISVLFLFGWLWYFFIKNQSIGAALITGFLFMVILPGLIWQSIWILRESHLTRIFPGDGLIPLPTGQPLTVRLLWFCSIGGLVPALISTTENIQKQVVWLQGALKVPRHSFTDRENSYLDQGILIVQADSSPKMALLTLQGVPDYYRVRGKTGCYLAAEPGDCQVQLFDLTHGAREIRQRLLVVLLGGSLLIAVLNTVFAYLSNEKYHQWRYAVQEHNWAKSSHTWPTTSATVSSAELRQTSPGKNQRLYQAIIRYDYQVAGVVYHGDRLYFGDRPSSAALVARKNLEHYPIGYTALIAYDPEMPERSTLEAGHVEKTGGFVLQARQSCWFLFGLSSMILIASISVSSVLSKRISRRLATMLSELS